jgi:hypothetical protein
MGPSDQGTITSISSVNVPTPNTAHANSNDDVVEDNDDRNATGASKQIKATSCTGLITNKRPNPASMKIPLLGTSTSSGWINAKKSNADIRKCAAIAKEARSRRLEYTDEESSNGMKTKYMSLPPDCLDQFKTIYDGTTTTSNNVFSTDPIGEVGGWISTKKSKADIRKCAAIAKEARSRRLEYTDEESSNGMKTEYMSLPPDRLEQFKTIYDGTTTTSNNVFSTDQIPTLSNDTLLPIIELYASSGNNYANNDSDEEENVDQHNDFCHECSEGGEVLCCGNCTLVFHLKCIGMDGVPEGNWLCQYCVDEDMDISSSNEEDEDLSPSDDNVGSVYSMSINDEDSDVEVSDCSDDTFDDKEDVELSCVTKRAPTPARNNGRGQVGQGMSTTSNIDHYSSTIITNANTNDSTNADDSTTTTHNVTNDATSSTIPIGASSSTITPIDTVMALTSTPTSTSVSVTRPVKSTTSTIASTTVNKLDEDTWADVLAFLYNKGKDFKHCTSHSFEKMPSPLVSRVMVYQIVIHCIVNPRSVFPITATTFSELSNMNVIQLSNQLMDLQSQLKTLLATSSAICLYTGMVVLLYSKAGYRMLSLDQVFPKLKSDQPGQCWAVSSHWANKYKSSMNIFELDAHMNFLSTRYNASTANDIQAHYDANKDNQQEMIMELDDEDDVEMSRAYVHVCSVKIILGTFSREIGNEKTTAAKVLIQQLKTTNPRITKEEVIKCLEDAKLRQVVDPCMKYLVQSFARSSKV